MYKRKLLILYTILLKIEFNNLDKRLADPTSPRLAVILIPNR